MTDEKMNALGFVELTDEELMMIKGGESGLNWNDWSKIANGWGSAANYNAGSVAAAYQYNPYDDF
ncbi:hypothetical protein LMG9449_1682 [Lactococcus lactis subsp. lactis]|uniref:Uncharacterized protein n=1 Tax=Lactococcus lactis subsp. lactis TaxID=1360 RepID=A0A0V8DUP6_LACLL|nr:hypothetical protein [Lactococcus lactis]KSU17358.1 hypothetical protein LMG9449_1682 [Lactococcus lactis subsp. lactis]